MRGGKAQRRRRLGCGGNGGDCRARGSDFPLPAELDCHHACRRRGSSIHRTCCKAHFQTPHIHIRIECGKIGQRTERRRTIGKMS